jgi:hypothetical protein
MIDSKDGFMYLGTLVGVITYILMKLWAAKNESVKLKTEFSYKHWFGENFITFIIGLIAGLAATVYADGWMDNHKIDSVDMRLVVSWSCGLMGGTVLFNVYPIVTSVEFWTAVKDFIFGWIKKKQP